MLKSGVSIFSSQFIFVDISYVAVVSYAVIDEI